MEPYYILVSHSQSNTPIHPQIQYHYADDRLLPQPEFKEHVIFMHYKPDENVNTPLLATSLSKDMIVSDVKVTAAPGAGEFKRNDRLYIIETTAALQQQSPSTTKPSAKDILAQFRTRNATLHRALTYPEVIQSSASP